VISRSRDADLRPACRANGFARLERVGDAFELSSRFTSTRGPRRATRRGIVGGLRLLRDGQSMSMWCAAGLTTASLAGRDVDADLQCPFHLAVDRLAGIVEERGAHGEARRGRPPT
jgi:hypothetical protein